MNVRVDHKEVWAAKNWCFWAVMLEKTLERPLDCKEIQLVNPKGSQPWTVIGRNDAEAEVTLTTWFEKLKCIMTTFVYIMQNARKCMSNRLTSSLGWCRTAWDWPWTSTTMFPWDMNFTVNRKSGIWLVSYMELCLDWRSWELKYSPWAYMTKME